MEKKVSSMNNLFMGINSEISLVQGKKMRAVNFDNAATTPPFTEVFNAIKQAIDYYGSIGRGYGQKAEITTLFYRDTREQILDFFGVKNREKYTIIYIGNTSDGLNKLARNLIKREKDIVLCTRMEHHSNDLPWRKVANVKYIEVDNLGRLKIDQYEEMFEKYGSKIKYVTVTGASNVTGYLNDIYKIARIAHRNGARIIVDGAQLVPHCKVEMERENQYENIDYLVFSAHKIYSPFGGGAIIGLRDRFNECEPDIVGGGVVELVKDKELIYLDTPERNEVGSPNFFGVVGMAKALDVIERLGYESIRKHEHDLLRKLIEGMKQFEEILLYGDTDNYEDRVGIVIFNIKNVDYHKIAEILSKNYGIGVRQGWFCAHPYCRRLMGLTEEEASAYLKDKSKEMPGMIRISLGMYNTEEEIDYLLSVIKEIITELRSSK